MNTLRTSLAALLCALVVPIQAGARVPPAPLDAQAKALVWGVAEDPPAEVLQATRANLHGRHYLVSDEWNLHLFHEHLQDRGGAYVGVGADQAYLFIGSMRAEIAWLTDYDPWIKWLHQAFHAFFEASPDAETFLTWWDKPRYKAARKLISERYAGSPDLKKVLFVFAQANWKVASRLKRLRRQLKKAGTRSYLTDPATYQHVKAIVEGGRIRPMVGDLTGAKALVAIGDASRKLGVPVRVLYLSNAENYWPYRANFRANILAQHFDERSLVIRTRATHKLNGDYRYHGQSGPNFQLWMKQPWVRRVKQVIKFVKVQSKDHYPVTIFDEDPLEARAGRLAPRKKAAGTR